MKKVAKLVLIVLLVLIMFSFSSCAIYGLSVIGNRNTSILNDTRYRSIEDLHEAYLTAFSEAYYTRGPTSDFYPKEKVFDFSEGSDVFVVCTYSSQMDGVDESNSLMIYIAKQDSDGYYLEVPDNFGVGSIFCAILYFNTNYEALANEWYYSEYITKDLDVCYGFAYKNKNDDYTLYFDGVKMKEVSCIDPFTQEEFTLCYGISDKTYSVLEMFFIRKNKRHTLEVKQREY
ncbi:MAG: hypothetical protein IJY13_00355 [Clostridia bacterium]|nr:hypothetical protein [Clostridia bacterium]